MERVSKEKTFLLAAIIVVVSLAVYCNSLFNGFVYDDKEQIVNNHWIRDMRYLPEIFSQSVWGFSMDAEEQGTANYYRPFMYVVYMINYYLFGLKAWGFHLANILFHTGTSVLVLLLADRLTSEQAGKPVNLQAEEPASTLTSASSSPSPLTLSLFPPFIAALLFATHPIHAEAVTWVASLPEVGFTFFYLLSFFFFPRILDIIHRKGN